MDLVSVVIPTYNRFKYVMNTIGSIKSQTYKNNEIIVVNDASSEEAYYTYDWPGVTIIHASINSKALFGYACAGFIRNRGIEAAKGKYIAFCDDDDVWLPYKLEKQLQAMQSTGCKMCSTDGWVGHGPYDHTREYPLHIAEHFYLPLLGQFRASGCTRLDNGIPDRFDFDLMRISNLIICSSLIIEKSILTAINNMICKRNGVEDYDTWLKALKYTDCAFIKDPCIYYDLGHGDGQNY
jgi:glycosyltransferase involved in cell wall biosynthesis